MNKFLKIKLISIALLFLVAPLFLTSISSAQTESGDDYSTANTGEGGNRILDRMTDVAGQGEYVTGEGAASVPRIVGLIINALLSITGLIFIILTVFAGFNWMTSNGNEEKIKKSVDTLKASVIGLIVTLSAWTIWNFIFANLIL